MQKRPPDCVDQSSGEKSEFSYKTRGLSLLRPLYHDFRNLSSVVICSKCFEKV